MRAKTATLALALFLGACMPTWQANVRKGLSTAAVGAEQSVSVSEVVCQQVMQGCIAAKTNPCEPLDRCLAVRHNLIKAAVVTQLTALAGHIAVDAKDQKKAEAALAEVIRLTVLIARALDALR